MNSQGNTSCQLNNPLRILFMKLEIIRLRNSGKDMIMDERKEKPIEGGQEP